MEIVRNGKEESWRMKLKVTNENFRNLYKPQKLLSIADQLAVGAVPYPEDSDSTWFKRRGGGGLPVIHYEVADVVQTARSNQLPIGQGHWTDNNRWILIALVIGMCAIFLYAFNNWLCCNAKRPTRRKRAIGRLRRVIQAIAVRRVPQL